MLMTENVDDHAGIAKCLICIQNYTEGIFIFFGWVGVPNLQKVSVNKIATPYFGNNNFMTPHHRYTLHSKQAKIVLKSVFLNKMITLSGSCDSLHFGHQKWPPPIFLQKFMTFLPKKMIAPFSPLLTSFLGDREIFWLNESLPY